MYPTIALILLLATALRILPMRLLPHGGGVDQWFWRAYIERVRKHKEFPPVLSQFRLDKAQWYPPLFPLMIAKLPAAVFEQYAGYLSVMLDLLRLLILLLVTMHITGSVAAVAVVGVVYALTPVLTTYNLQLNPRGLGALFLDAFILGLGFSLLLSGMPWWISALIGGLVLITHKMTTQLLVIIMLAASILLNDPKPVLLIPLSMIAAILFSRGFYIKVAIAHWDILKFWFENWRWMGSNPILESPIYGKPGYESPTKFYRSGLKAALRRLTFIIGFNPWMPATLAIGAVLWWLNYTMSEAELWAFSWLAIVFCFAIATTLIPWLRCLGQGYLYGYNGAFPAALALGLTWPHWSQEWITLTLFAATVIASSVSLFAFFKSLKNSRTLKVDSELTRAMEYLSVLPKGVVMCLPQHWHDVVAYKTGKTVAFGGHGYGFNLLAPMFPRLKKPVKELIAEHQIQYLLIWPAYVNEQFINELPHSKIEKFGEYELHQFAALPVGDV